MVDKTEMPGRHVRADIACGAALLEGESDDDCSSAGISAAAPMLRKFYAD